MSAEQEATNMVLLADLAQRLGRPDAGEWFTKAVAALDHAIDHQFIGPADDCPVCDSRWMSKQEIKRAALQELIRLRNERAVTQ